MRIELLLLLLLAACAGREGAESVDASAALVSPAEAAPAPPAPASNPRVPSGYYECYFHGDYGMQNSSIISLTILSGEGYEAMEERGRYVVDGDAVRMETGPLSGRVARMRESSGKPALVFLRRENDQNGRPVIDISDTWCYFEPR